VRPSAGVGNLGLLDLSRYTERGCIGRENPIFLILSGDHTATGRGGLSTGGGGMGLGGSSIGRGHGGSLRIGGLPIGFGLPGCPAIGELHVESTMGMIPPCRLSVNPRAHTELIPHTTVTMTPILRRSVVAALAESVGVRGAFEPTSM
jgi:hypothetical protein